MAINFPTSLDNFTNPSSGNTLDSPSHSLQHSDINDAVEALERKVGVGTAVAGSASAGQVLTISAAGTSTWSTPTAPGLIQLTPGTVTVAGSGSSASTSSTGAVTFGSATSLALDSLFSSTYDNYLIQLNVSGVSGSEVDINGYMRNNGVDNTTNMNTERFFQYSSTLTGQETGTTMNFGLMASSYPTFPNYTVFLNSPNLARVTTFNSQGGYVTPSGVPRQFFFWGYTLDTTSYNGIKFYPSSGHFSGIIRIYGIRG